MKSVAVSLGVVAAGFFFIAPAQAADSGWVSVSKANSMVRQLRRSANEIPTSVQCRKGPSASTKVEYRIKTGANSAKRNWAVIAKDDSYSWQPGAQDFQPQNARQGAKDWRRVESHVVSLGGSGVKRYCSLWHSKKSGDFSTQEPTVWRGTR